MKRFILIFSLLAFALPTICSEPSNLDTSFNETGILNLISSTTSLPETVQSLAVQTDGKIIFAGYTTPSSAEFGILGRLNADGSLDTTFNASGSPAGYVIITFGSATSSTLFKVKLQTDGKIVAVGTIVTGGVSYAFVTRYLDNGLLDTVANGGSGFGTSGQGYINLYPSTYDGAELYSLALQSDGVILTAGSAFESSTNSLPMLARFTSTGLLDTTFNATSSIPGYSIFPQISNYLYGAFFDIALQPNNKIVTTGYIGTVYQSPYAYGYANTTDNSQLMVIARYTNGSTSSGILDATFNPNGTAGYILPSLGTVSAGYGLALQGDEKIVVAGWSNLSLLTPVYTIIRLNTTGMFDTTFNSTGINQQSSSTQYSSSAQSVMMQPDQTILTAGMGTSGNSLLATRYNQDGIIDSTFNFSKYESPSSLQFRAVGLNLDQKIFAAGTNLTSSAYSLLFYAFLGGQTLEPVEASATNTYGYNSTFLSDFLYITFYAQVITSSTVRDAAISSVNSILTSYTNNYSDQPNFNYVSYLYIINTELLAAQASLSLTYPDSSEQISDFFTYIIEREYQLSV